jgi:hypothetical protein
MRYKDAVIHKLEQLENRLISLSSSLTYPNMTVEKFRDMIDELKARIEEVKSLVNANPSE